jgi:hypothetical protein
MSMVVLGSVIAALGLPFFVRGLRLSLGPDSPYADRIRERNLRAGLEADMRIWGRKVRRLGFLLLLSGVSLVVYSVWTTPA